MNEERLNSLSGRERDCLRLVQPNRKTETIAHLLGISPHTAADRIKSARAKLGGVDVAIMNAAVAVDGLTDVSEDELRYAIAADFTAYMLGAYEASRRIEEGDIVFTGSMSAHILGPSSTIYAGIKAGIAGFAEALRKELGEKGIRVALVEPGKTKADFGETSDEEQKEKVAAEETLRAEDIAVGVHYILTQPRRAVVQQLTIVPRAEGGE